MLSRRHLVFVLTSPLAAPRMLRGQGRFWREAGFEVSVISSPGADLERFGGDEGVHVVGVPMEREISPLRDVLSLWKLWRALIRLRPDVVECGTPKAGLLGGLAAWLACVPVRIYTLHGLRLETLDGLRRGVSLWAERVAVLAAHRVLCVSPSLLKRARGCGVLGADEGEVAGPGSANGIDLGRFRSSHSKPRTPSLPVVGFVGRLTRDKGIVDLIEAFDLLLPRFPNLTLLLVGDFERGDPPPVWVRTRIERDPRIECTGFIDDPARLYAGMDVVALPSRREGFPIVALEAAAAARPLVASCATGVVDAVVDGVTGLVTPPGESGALAEAIAGLLGSPTRASALGRAARERVARLFPPERVWKAKRAVYQAELRRAVGRRLPFQRFVKRGFDLAASSALLLVAAPLVSAAALAVAVTMGRPVFFRQQRPGFDEKPFVILKLRTMDQRRDPGGELRSDDERLTPVGRLLRRWSLDELPQLWNVLRGEMALVGPRPLLIDYLPLYTRRQRLRSMVRPGLTGWAQVEGRNRLDWPRRLELDAAYAESWSLWIDVSILIKTIGLCLGGRGVEASGRATPKPFQGEAA